MTALVITAATPAVDAGTTERPGPTTPVKTRVDHHKQHAARTRQLVHRLRATINRERSSTWAWQATMLHPPTRSTFDERRTTSPKYLRWILRRWADRHRDARATAQHPPHESAWLCIHRYEGSWTDPGSPYWGGLQMDIGFQQTYGLTLYRAKGTADHWTPLEQMWVAERAYVTRGFWPWPNTARWCGLI